MDEQKKRSLPHWLPFVVGALLVVQFAALGVWQINRGLEKRDTKTAFSNQVGAVEFRSGADVRSYQPLKVAGRFDDARQFLLDNIILQSRYGYYVLTPLETAGDEPLLIVNRGWIEKDSDAPAGLELSLPDTRLTIYGRVGSLPRAGYRMGDPITARDAWPQLAVYPKLEELAASLGRDVQPFVLLMDPNDEHGFVRHWVPEEMGPSRHFGYAVQWFAMAVVLAGLLLWHYRKRSFADA